MNQTPEENKKPTAQKPPQSPAPQWNPYYRRNPDGTPGGHDRTLRQSAAARETAARSAQYKPGQATPAQNQTPPPARPQNAPQTAPREGQHGLSEPLLSLAGGSRGSDSPCAKPPPPPASSPREHRRQYPRASRRKSPQAPPPRTIPPRPARYATAAVTTAP